MNPPSHVIVSGGSRGLGLEIAKALLEDGRAVSALSRRRTDAVATLEKDPRVQGRFSFEEADLADRSSLTAFVRRAVERFGGPWALINCAAAAPEGLLAVLPPETIDETLRVNLGGTMHLTRECLRAMLPLRRGRILMISSIVGLRGFKGLSVYSATKAALDGFARSLARELGEAGITVNSVAPGFLDTEMTGSLSETQRRQIVGRTPLGRLGRTEDCLPVIRLLLSEESSFLTGQTIVIDGGLSV
jgi:3-oxoacyl-[acyl-carrier protein] reductase